MNLITQDELNLLSDTKYKGYVNAIEKCLKNFESSTEWADLISSLGKLKKLIQSYPKYQYIPKRISVCKRLSQCLHPALPSGVHLKALEVYTVLFQNIGVENLAKDLFLYSSGLFPLLENAALSVKPVLLNIYETYFLPLKQYLNPCLTGILLALLPGLEEGSDFYERTYNLLRTICEQSGRDFFFTSLWSTMIFSTNIRFPAIQFTLTYYDKKKLMEDQLFLIGNSIDTMINSICSCLLDSNPLVQRSILDFILLCLPINNTQITYNDKIKLISIVIHLVLRRDMSLNRRIYAWFLGQNLNFSTKIELELNEKNENYFLTNSKLLLVNSIKTLLNNNNINYLIDDFTTGPLSIKMLKIISSLIEKQEIGQYIVEDILLDLLLYVYNECNNLNEKNEIIKATSNFIFQSFQLNFIWDFCAKQLDIACKEYIENENETNENSRPHILSDLYTFILDLTNLDVYIEVQTEYLPLMLNRIIITLCNYSFKMNNQDLTKLFELCLKILKKVVPKVVTNLNEEKPDQQFSSVKHYRKKSECRNEVKQALVQTDCDGESFIDTDEEAVHQTLDDIIDIIEMVNYTIDFVDPLSSPYKPIEYEVTEMVKKDDNMPTKTEDAQNSIKEIKMENITDYDNLIENCVAQLKVLLKLFISNHILEQNTSVANVDTFFTHLFYKNQTDRPKEFKDYSSELNNLQMHSIKIKKTCQTYLSSFRKLNKFLIKLFLYPRCTGNGAIQQQYHKADNQSLVINEHFDDWLKYLFVISCLNNELIRLPLVQPTSMSNEYDNANTNFVDFQLASIHTILELFFINNKFLLNNNQTTAKDLVQLPFINADIRNRFKLLNNTETIKLVVANVFTQKQIHFIFYESHIGELIGRMLWTYLGDEDHNGNNLYKYHKLSSTLFCLLHDILPNNLCENIISYGLTIDDERTQLDTIKRFINLWHWSKEIHNEYYLLNKLNLNNLYMSKKTFERSILIILDLANKCNASVNKYIQEWLLKCINDFDLCCILDILITCLLHPNTARVSIQFYNSNDGANYTSRGLTDATLLLDSLNETETSQSYESKVYAISNEKGNVVYHVNNETTERIKASAPQPHQQSQFLLTSLPDITTKSLTSLTNSTSSTNVKAPPPLRNLELPTALIQDRISLRVNPFMNDCENVKETDFVDDTSASTAASTPASDLPMKHTVSENNFLEKYRAMKNDLELHKLHREKISKTKGDSKKTSPTASVHENNAKHRISQNDEDFDMDTDYNQTQNDSFEFNTDQQNQQYLDQIDENFAYILIYNQDYDYKRILFILNCINNLLDKTNNVLLFKLLFYCKIKNNYIQSIYNGKLIDLFLRHLKSMHGENFYSNTSFSNQQNFTYTYFELIIVILLFYIRSYYSIPLSSHSSSSSATTPTKAGKHSNDHNIIGNKNVKIICLQILNKLIKVLIKNLNQQTSVQIHAILDNCKLQKTILNCLYSTTINLKINTFNKYILNLNAKNDYSFICELYNCIETMINLEYNLKFDTNLNTPDGNAKSDEDDFLLTRTLKSTMKYIQTTQITMTNTTRYINNLPIINQSMYISSVLYYLRNLSLYTYHIPTLNLIHNTLPYTSNALKSMSAFIIEQLCCNLLQIVSFYDNYSLNLKHVNIQIPDFIVVILKELSYLLHYCLVLNTNSYFDVIDGNLMTSCIGHYSHVEIHPKSPKNILDIDQNQAKDSMINLLPSIVSRMTHIWKAMNTSESFNNEQTSWFLGHPKVIKAYITDTLGPIASNHGVPFTLSIATVWGEKKKKQRLIIEQTVLIDLVKSLRAYFPISTIIQNIQEIVRSSSNSVKDKKKSPINIWLLQFFHSYKEPIKANDTEFFTYLCMFFKECIQCTSMSPAFYFQLFRILHDYVSMYPILVDDKKYSKDIQDTTHKLVDLCSTLVASSLQQTTWLRKNYAVKLTSTSSTLGASTPTLSSSRQLSSRQSTNDEHSIVSTTSSIAFDNELSESDGHNSVIVTQDHQSIHNVDLTSGLDKISLLSDNIDTNDANNNIIQSYQALNILAEYLAKTLDIVYKSDEKDRLVVPLLNNLLSNIWPYLKTHVIANRHNFFVASQLLMNLTTYPYTRKTWKKEVFDGLFDSSYFYVDSETLYNYKVIVDNLISNDRAMFKDVIAQTVETYYGGWRILSEVLTYACRQTEVRVTYPQSSGLFTSREQESEQRSQLLKRLAFVIYASEKDQYQKNMPEIQECIAQMLKNIQSTNLYSTIFLLFRVLLLRISSRHLIALWPTILSELVLILLQIEQDLTEEMDPNRSSKPTVLETLTYPITNLSNLTTLVTSKFSVYLSACKLLDLILTLPYALTSQFQLYKWSFLNGNQTESDLKEQFIPYMTRIASLLRIRYTNQLLYKTTQLKLTGSPLVKQRQIQSFLELKPFFETVTSQMFFINTDINTVVSNNLKLYEQTIHDDFVEGWLS